MLRICLIVVIVMGLATIAVSRVKVAATLTETRAKLAETEQERDSARSAETKAKKEARAAVETADKATKELELTKTNLEEAAAKADQQLRRADDLEARLNDTTRTKNEVQARLAEWEAFGVTPLRVREIIDQNKKLVADMDAVSKENQVLFRRVNTLEQRLANYEGEKHKVDLPVGLKGKVIAVDPKYEFVVLNIGEDDGVLERGEMLVNRAGKLVAKVRILSVQAKRCVANVLSDWKQSEILEGDMVLVGL